MKKLYPWIAVFASFLALAAGIIFVIERYKKLLSDLVKLDDSDFDEIEI